MVLVPASAVDDLVFCSSLFFCFSLAKTYKGMEACDKRREFGAGLGLFVSWFLCGTGVCHAILIAWGNVVIIKATDRSYLHLLSLSYTWLYLIYIYNTFSVTPYAMWIYQTIALRMVGLAYELLLFDNFEHRKSERVHKDLLECTEQSSTSEEGQKTDVSKMEETTQKGFYGLDKSPLAIDIIAYAFFFIGIHKGPYYSWKVFYKNLYESSKADNRNAISNTTVSNQRKAFITGFMYIILQSAFPSGLYCEQEFYKNYNGGCRFLYGVPQLIMYFLRSYTIILLCSSVFTEAGFTFYPCNSLNLPKEKSVKKDTVTKCLENHMLLFNPIMSDTVRVYDMPTGCWFSAYPYLYTIKATKEVRSAFSFFLWTVWRGASATEVLLAVTTWVYVHLEIIYSDILNFKSNADNSIWNTCLWIMRLLYMVYITPCLIMYDSEMVFSFYSSVLWTYHCVLVGLTFSAAMIKSQKLDSYLIA